MNYLTHDEQVCKEQLISEIKIAENEIKQCNNELKTLNSRLIWHCEECESDNTLLEDEFSIGLDQILCDVCITPITQDALNDAKTANNEKKVGFNNRKQKAVIQLSLINEQLNKIDLDAKKREEAEIQRKRIEERSNNLFKYLKNLTIGALAFSIISLIFVLGDLMINNTNTGGMDYVVQQFANRIGRNTQLLLAHFVTLFSTITKPAKYAMIINNVGTFFKVIIGNIQDLVAGL